MEDVVNSVVADDDADMEWMVVVGCSSLNDVVDHHSSHHRVVLRRNQKKLLEVDCCS